MQPKLVLQQWSRNKTGVLISYKCSSMRHTSHTAPTAAVMPQSPAACTSVPENLNAGGSCAHKRQQSVSLTFTGA